ncbi:unnamed protein product [Linum trigynum]|uniref:Uncharacterized protein n=1 Tax=Linum trigynum TaxID=586398 RepID=A0AAV2G2R2_9ROSI
MHQILLDSRHCLGLSTSPHCISPPTPARVSSSCTFYRSCDHSHSDEGHHVAEIHVVCFDFVVAASLEFRELALELELEGGHGLDSGFAGGLEDGCELGDLGLEPGQGLKLPSTHIHIPVSNKQPKFSCSKGFKR